MSLIIVIYYKNVNDCILILQKSYVQCWQTSLFRDYFEKFYNVNFFWAHSMSLAFRTCIDLL